MKFSPPWRHAALLAALACTAPLNGCALLVGGAALGSALVVTDRRTSGAQVDDQSIELKAVNRVHEAIGDRGHVSVTSFNREVLITGEVGSDADKGAVEQAVSRIDSVRSVVNELAITAPTGFGGYSSDTLITSKVKASFIDAKDIQANAIKVTTERGNVYLMGRVTEREATRAADVARGVSGVRKVVKVFEIITEAELAGIQMPPPAAPAASEAAR